MTSCVTVAQFDAPEQKNFAEVKVDLLLSLEVGQGIFCLANGMTVG